MPPTAKWVKQRLIVQPGNLLVGHVRINKSCAPSTTNETLQGQFIMPIDSMHGGLIND